MSAREILTLADEVRGKTLKLLEATPDDWLLWAPPGTQNHITWHAGHALWLADVLCVQPITGKTELPPGWEETFGQYCRPPAQTKSWPAKSELIQRLSAQHARVREVVGKLTDMDLHSPPPHALPRQSTLSRYIIHGFHDEANHQGEMYLLLKLRRANGS